MSGVLNDMGVKPPDNNENGDGHKTRAWEPVRKNEKRKSPLTKDSDEAPSPEDGVMATERLKRAMFAHGQGKRMQEFEKVKEADNEEEGFVTEQIGAGGDGNAQAHHGTTQKKNKGRSGSPAAWSGSPDAGLINIRTPKGEVGTIIK